MAATGLRAIRYAKEVDGIGAIVANDMDKGAVASIQRNVEFNDVEDKVQAHHNDARVLMIQHPQVRVPCKHPAAAPVTIVPLPCSCKVYQELSQLYQCLTCASCTKEVAWPLKVTSGRF
jgi:tRNA G37 N-methylase Trm5